MRFIQISSIASALLFASALPCSASPRVHRGPTAQRTFRERTATRPKPAATRAITPERATQIQTALISNGYLTGSPTGVWDDETKAAMEKLQADNGWQTKLVPDARAIIKLGLGPNAASAANPAEPSGNESKQ